jgi:hypothetical protein
MKLLLASIMQASEQKIRSLKSNHSFVHQWLYSPLLGPGRFLSFVILHTSVGLLGQGISPSQGLYIHIGQYKHRINAHRHRCSEWDSNS